LVKRFLLAASGSFQYLAKILAICFLRRSSAFNGKHLSQAIRPDCLVILMKGLWQKSQTTSSGTTLSGYLIPAALRCDLISSDLRRSARLAFLRFLFSSRQPSQGTKALNLPLRLTGIIPHLGQYSISVMFMPYLLWRQ
jgi:hypothetical protein